MMSHEAAHTLVQVICVLLAFATLSWLVMYRPIKVAPNASIRFALANLSILLALLLYTQRSDEPNYLYWLVADLIVLFGFGMLRNGAQTLYRLPLSWKTDLAIAASTALLMLFAEPSFHSAGYLVAVLSVAAGLSMLGLTRDHYFAFRDTLTSFALNWFVIPLFMISMLFFLRAVAIAIYPDQVNFLASIHHNDAVPILWMYITLILVLNILVIGNTINKLVTKIMNIANKDPLTQCYNRFALNRKIAKQHQAWIEEHAAYSVILFDLDYFKTINDKYGHMVGDTILVETAKLVQASIKANDILYRYGGEEFLILLPNTLADQCFNIALRCQQVLNQAQIQHEDLTLKVTASFGCATINKGLTCNELLLKADNAMYKAKEAGRNCIVRS